MLIEIWPHIAVTGIYKIVMNNQLIIQIDQTYVFIRLSLRYVITRISFNLEIATFVCFVKQHAPTYTQMVTIHIEVS